MPAQGQTLALAIGAPSVTLHHSPEAESVCNEQVPGSTFHVCLYESRESALCLRLGRRCLESQLTLLAPPRTRPARLGDHKRADTGGCAVPQPLLARGASGVADLCVLCFCSQTRFWLGRSRHLSPSALCIFLPFAESCQDATRFKILSKRISPSIKIVGGRPNHL